MVETFLNGMRAEEKSREEQRRGKSREEQRREENLLIDHMLIVILGPTQNTKHQYNNNVNTQDEALYSSSILVIPKNVHQLNTNRLP